MAWENNTIAERNRTERMMTVYGPISNERRYGHLCEGKNE